MAGPRNLAALAPTIRQRVAAILDNLPMGEPFNWVERVSIELTTQMLATLCDFPFEERYKLTHWSDIATSPRKAGFWNTLEERDRALNEYLLRMTELRDERVDRPGGHDLLSMLAHSKSTRNMPPGEFLGNLILLIVGGNDTTRNSISGGVVAMNRWPEEFEELKADRSKIPNAVAEIIRWQTPLAFMRRMTTEHVEIGGRTIPAGEKVLMPPMRRRLADVGNGVVEQPDAPRLDRCGEQVRQQRELEAHRAGGEAFRIRSTGVPKMYHVTRGLKAINPQVPVLLGGQGQNRTGRRTVPNRGACRQSWGGEK